MSDKKVSKKVILLGLLISLIYFVIAIEGIWFVLNSIRIGPGLPPPQAMPGWYITDASKGNEYACSSLFPNISPYCKVGKYSDGKFISVWYFDNESQFLNGEDTLYRYLEENDSLSQQELNISTELQEVIERREANNSGSVTFGPHSFNTTGYESPETSGYFLVYERPFLETREDYFIVYYGIKGMTNLSEQTPALRELVTESYYMSNEKGKVDSLKG